MTIYYLFHDTLADTYALFTTEKDYFDFMKEFGIEVFKNTGHFPIEEKNYIVEELRADMPFKEWVNYC